MRQVRTCDFCGDDATGLYEPLPASIPDAPRLLLCDACRDRLSSVVDPLVAHLGGDGDAGVGPASSPRDASSGASPGRTGPDAAADDLAEREWPEDPGEASVEPTGSADGEATDGPSRTSNRPSVEPAADDDPDSTPESVGAEAAAAAPSADPAEEVSVSESRDASGRSQTERGGAPRGYRKVMRFLENRQLPIDRAEAERLASEAYDLDAGEVGTAIDHAVQYGRLREVSGELRR